MKYLPLLLLTSCSLISTGSDSYFASGPPPKKQKQKILNLQRKLEVAEKEKVKVEEEVEQLRREMDLAQIHLIQRQINDFERELEIPTGRAKKLARETTTLFLQERELLHELIRSGPSPSSFEAQIVLDQILRMITSLNNESHFKLN